MANTTHVYVILGGGGFKFKRSVNLLTGMICTFMNFLTSVVKVVICGKYIIPE